MDKQWEFPLRLKDLPAYFEYLEEKADREWWEKQLVDIVEHGS